MNEFSVRPVRRLLMVLALLLSAVGPAAAARVEDVYAAVVPVADASPEALQAAFGEALRRVLVKATGRASAAQDTAILNGLGDPAALVQQYRRDGTGNLWARFDAAALRAKLEAAGVPAWGEDRPLTVIWLAYDAGGGERDVLSSAGSESPVPAALRRDLLNAAAGRGVPVLLPLRDSQEIAALSYADLWGDFSEPVVRASARYQADAVLIGRARLYPAPLADVRWTLMLGNERLEWRGAVADGPQGLAERLSQRLAATTAPAGSGPLRLAVSGIGTLDQYGTVLGYLRGLDVIQSFGVGYIAGDAMVFDLQLRGDREQLTRALASRRVMEPAADFSLADLPPGAAPDLAYRLVSAP